MNNDIIINMMEIKDVQLKEISVSDINVFDDTEYQNLSKEDRLRLIKDSIKGECKGKKFKFYLVFVKEQNVGFINVCGHSESVVSIAPEIRKEFRRKGYAFLASDKAFDIVKKLGYKVAIADVKVDNVASCKLQEKLGFEHVRNYYNKKGNEMRLYLKSL